MTRTASSPIGKSYFRISFLCRIGNHPGVEWIGDRYSGMRIAQRCDKLPTPKNRMSRLLGGDAGVAVIKKSVASISAAISRARCAASVKVSAGTGIVWMGLPSASKNATLKSVSPSIFSPVASGFCWVQKRTNADFVPKKVFHRDVTGGFRMRANSSLWTK
jgi:hypothetical protein